MSLRITDNYMANLMVRNMHHNLAQVLRYQQMASSMRRVNSFADDPRAVSAANRYRSLLSANAQYQRNIERGRAFVNSADSALLSVVDLLSEARQLAMQESSALGTDTTNDHAADVVDSLVQQLLNTLNTTVEGDYIFSGYRTNIPPFVLSGDNVQYQGDSGEIRAQIGPYTELGLNIPGSVFMGSNNAVLSGFMDIAPALTAATALADLNLGQGWQAGELDVKDGTGMTYRIDLSAATTIGDVINQINIDSGGNLTAAVTADGKALQISGVGPLTVDEVNDGTTAESLGLLGSSDAGLLVGQNIRVAPTPATLLSEIPSLSGSLPLGSLLVRIGENETVVDFSTATTIGDLQTLLNTAVPELDLQLDGAVLSVVSGTTESFVILDADGSHAASDLGIAGTGSPARLFGVLSDLKAALLAHDSVAIRGTLAELGAVEDLVLAQTIKIGGKENVLDWMGTSLQARDERLQMNLSIEMDADIAKVATELSRAEAAYQASLMVTSRLFEVNLMQYLR